jgi:hypothetical protein
VSDPLEPTRRFGTPPQLGIARRITSFLTVDFAADRKSIEHLAFAVPFRVYDFAPRYPDQDPRRRLGPTTDQGGFNIYVTTRVRILHFEVYCKCSR